MRTIICHYHIYKNSGTSFDALLTENYGDRHLCFDGPFPFFSIDQQQLIRIITSRSNVIAFSSHQIRLPIPVSLDFLVLPVVFVRHPLLRIQSIYQFKRKAFDGTVTSQAAQEKSFDAWISHCFADEQEVTNISNAQTYFLGAVYRQESLSRTTPYGIEYDRHQAIRNLQNVRLLARTEHFYDDVSRFPEILQQYGLAFDCKQMKPHNTTSTDLNKPIEERLEILRTSLSKKNYQKLLNANAQDIFLLNYVTQRLAQK